MLIDAHAHIGPFAHYDSTPERLRAYLDTVGMTHALVSNRAAGGRAGGGVELDEAEANEACLEVCRADPRLIPLYWAKPGSADSLLTAFRGALRAAPFAGAVFSPELNGFAADARIVDPYLQALAEVQRPALFHVGMNQPASPERVAQIARRHPSLPIVIYGAGQPAQRQRIITLIRQVRSARDAQLYWDTAQADADEIARTVRLLGVATVLFGTDALCRGDTHGEEVAKLLGRLRELLSPEDFLAVTSENARRIFRLPG